MMQQVRVLYLKKVNLDTYLDVFTLKVFFSLLVHEIAIFIHPSTLINAGVRGDAKVPRNKFELRSHEHTLFRPLHYIIQPETPPPPEQQTKVHEVLTFWCWGQRRSGRRGEAGQEGGAGGVGKA